MLMFPNIFGSNPQNYKYQWVVLLYEDPNKDFNEISSTAKSALKKVFDIKAENIKLKTVINNVTIKKIAPEMTVRLVVIDHNSDEEPPEFNEYLVDVKNKSITERQYKNLPADKAIDLIKKRPFLDKAFQIFKRIKFGPKEYRVTQFTEGEITRKLKEQVEEIYNSEIEITEKELQNDLYSVNFITDKLKKVLTEYLANVDEK